LYTLYNGDCLDIEWPQVDAIITDIPYKITMNKWDIAIPFDDLWRIVKHALKQNGVFITTASQPFTSALVMSNLKWFKHEWIWVKNRGGNFANTVREPFKEHESILVFSNGRWTYNKQMQERTGGGIDLVGKRVSVGKKDREGMRKFMHFDDIESLPKLRVPSSWQKFNTEVGLHPTQKPGALYEYLIRTYTNEGDTVLDPCMGSGTTGVACKNLGRNFIGIEKDHTYFEIAKQRIEKAGCT
jgi:site-specific DNA-methyltransferase (adenine-specific)